MEKGNSFFLWFIINCFTCTKCFIQSLLLLLFFFSFLWILIGKQDTRGKDYVDKVARTLKYRYHRLIDWLIDHHLLIIDFAILPSTIYHKLCPLVLIKQLRTWRDKNWWFFYLLLIEFKMAASRWWGHVINDQDGGGLSFFTFDVVSLHPKSAIDGLVFPFSSILWAFAPWFMHTIIGGGLVIVIW